jgi:hypothetical protein
VLIACVQFSLHGTSALTKRIELLNEALQLGVELTRAFRMSIRVCAKRGITLAQEVQLLDLLDQFRVLRVRCGCRGGTLSLLKNKRSGTVESDAG